VVVISHDRDLLDNAVDWTLHLEAGSLGLYRGGYSAFERQRREVEIADAIHARAGDPVDADGAGRRQRLI
jgi:ATP-binding cassette subfamily F protein 3